MEKILVPLIKNTEIDESKLETVNHCHTIDELSTFLCKDAGKLTQEVIDSKKKDIEKIF